MVGHKRSCLIILLSCSLLFLSVPGVRGFSEPSNSLYECRPSFLSGAAQPNILIMLDNSGSMNELAVPESESYEGAPLGTRKYYGYFNPAYFYAWDGNKFIHKYRKIEYTGTPGSGGSWTVEDLNGSSHDLLDSEIETGDDSGLWDGNFMNYAAMRKIDVVRKVIMGGAGHFQAGRRQPGQHRGIQFQVLQPRPPESSGCGYSIWRRPDLRSLQRLPRHLRRLGRLGSLELRRPLSPADRQAGAIRTRRFRGRQPGRYPPESRRPGQMGQ